MPNPTSGSDVAGTNMADRHVPYLDGIRGLAALYVSMTHVMTYFPHFSPASTADRMNIFVFGGGHFAVDVFIVLSGYCLMVGAVNGKNVTPAQFISKRALRILPPYFASLALSLLVLSLVIGNRPGAAWTVPRWPDEQSLVAHALLAQDWLGKAVVPINPVTWSVAVEWKIYFLFPFLAAYMMSSGPLRTALGAIVVSYAVFAALYVNDWLNPSALGASVYYVGLFAAGMATAYCLAKNLHRTIFGKPTLYAASLVFFVGVVTIIFKKYSIVQVGSFFGGGLACCWLALLYRQPASAVARFLACAPIRRLGEVSFSLYLVHPVAFEIVRACALDPWLLHSRHPIWWSFASMIPAAVALALVFHYLIERPSVQLSKRVGRKKPATLAFGAGCQGHGPETGARDRG